MIYGQMGFRKAQEIAVDAVARPELRMSGDVAGLCLADSVRFCTHSSFRITRGHTCDEAFLLCLAPDRNWSPANRGTYLKFRCANSSGGFAGIGRTQ